MRTDRLRALALLVLLTVGLSSCRALGGQEPEQRALVSAIGIDPDPDGVRLSAEILVPLESSGSEVRVLSAVGDTAASAFDALRSDLPRNLLFGHCAVLVFGDGIAESAVAEILNDARLPPEMQAVTAADARGLLLAGGYATPAAGYDLQAILAANSGIRCRIYELLQDGGEKLTAAELPRFALAPEESGKRFEVVFSQDVSQRTKETEGDVWQTRRAENR